MKFPYAIVFWNEGSNQPHPLMNPLGWVENFASLEAADQAAEDFESKYGLEARVISLESIHE